MSKFIELTIYDKELPNKSLLKLINTSSIQSIYEKNGSVKIEMFNEILITLHSYDEVKQMIKDKEESGKK